MTVVKYRGYEMYVLEDEDIGDTLIQTGEWEPRVTEIINEMVTAGDVCVDVGANYGVHTLDMHRNCTSTGTVYAVEPNPLTANLLRRTVARNDGALDAVQVVERAVMPTRGPVTLARVRERDEGMVRVVAESTPSEEFNVYADPFGAMAVTLDDIYDGHIDFLKMDVEGVEVDLIPTLDLTRIDAMVVELHDYSTSEERQRELVDYLASRGPVHEFGRNVLWG